MIILRENTYSNWRTRQHRKNKIYQRNHPTVVTPKAPQAVAPKALPGATSNLPAVVTGKTAGTAPKLKGLKEIINGGNTVPKNLNINLPATTTAKTVSQEAKKKLMERAGEFAKRHSKALKIGGGAALLTGAGIGGAKLYQHYHNKKED